MASEYETFMCHYSDAITLWENGDISGEKALKKLYLKKAKSLQQSFLIWKWQ